MSLSVMVTAWLLLHRLVGHPLGPLLKRGMARSFAQVRSNGQATAGS
ncbi:hypothetical protein [Streptacidiphilus neutrinimicus]|nr:hypothetical protein [Streptacidiphilus neutrinimicus]